MDDEHLHVSSFVLVKNTAKDSIVLLRAGSSYPVTFERAKLLLPAKILAFGENPRHVAENLLSEQMNGIQNPKVEFVTMQSYLGAHWDIVFLYEITIDSINSLKPKMPFTELGFFKLSNLPTEQIAYDHLEVLDELRREQESEKDKS